MKFYTNEGNNDWVFNDIVCFEEGYASLLPLPLPLPV